jgi:hypothetical protein
MFFPRLYVFPSKENTNCFVQFSICIDAININLVLFGERTSSIYREMKGIGGKLLFVYLEKYMYEYSLEKPEVAIKHGLSRDIVNIGHSKYKMKRNTAQN